MSPLAALLRRRPAPPRSVRPPAPPVSRGLLVQHWNDCPQHGHQLVSILEPGCSCSPGGTS